MESSCSAGMPELAARGEARVSADLRRQWDIEAAQQRQSSGSEGDDKSAPRAVDARPGAAAEGAMAIGDFDRMPEHRRVTLEVRGVSAQVPALFGQPTLAARLAPARLRRKVSSAGGGDRGTAHEGGGAGDRVMNTILFDVWARVCPGEVLALMGPSGSGKTTLLSIMGGRAAKGMRTRGEVLFNGLPLTKRVKRRVGFVQQDDLLYEALTVHETLWYAAMLRLPREMPRREKERRVEAVVAALGLQKARDTIIGGFMRRGVSGGERKRVSVGHELLTNPSTLLADEPTSGLDATTALHLMEVLRELARGGRAVATTIHQPSSRLYQQVDSLLLLSQGHAVYFGGAACAVDYLDRLGYEIPPRTSAADFLLDVASGEVGAGARAGEASRQFLVRAAELFLGGGGRALEGFSLGDEGALEAARAAAEAGAPTRLEAAVSAGAAERWRSNKATRRAGSLAAVAADSSALAGEHTWGAAYGTQVQLLFRRFLKTRRFESLSVQDVSQYMAVALLAGCFYWQAGRGILIGDAQQTIGLLFFGLLFLSFRALFISLFTWPEQQRYIIKERASGMYRLSAVFWARTLSDLPLELAIPTAFVVIVYLMGWLRMSAAGFFGTYGIYMLSMLCAQSIGLLLGAAVGVAKTAQAIASVVMLTFVLTAGFFATALPSWIAWMRYASYLYYALGALLTVQFLGRDFYACAGGAAPADPAADPACAPVEDLQAALGTMQGIDAGEAWRNVGILLGFLVVLRAAVYVALRRKTAS